MDKSHTLDTEEIAQTAHDFVEQLDDEQIAVVINLILCRALASKSCLEFDSMVEREDGGDIGAVLRRTTRALAAETMAQSAFGALFWGFYFDRDYDNYEQEQQRKSNDIPE